MNKVLYDMVSISMINAMFISEVGKVVRDCWHRIHSALMDEVVRRVLSGSSMRMSQVANWGEHLAKQKESKVQRS